jgi:hypothetical protein
MNDLEVAAVPSAALRHVTNDFGTVKLAVEIGIQVVGLVRHQVAEWPVGTWDTAIA